jgi:hypothetical protein
MLVTGSSATGAPASSTRPVVFVDDGCSRVVPATALIPTCRPHPAPMTVGRNECFKALPGDYAHRTDTDGLTLTPQRQPTRRCLGTVVPAGPSPRQ